MSRIRVRPSVARGRVPAPPSKSYTHRALVAGFLSGRRTTLIGPLDSDDTRATVAALTALGSRVETLATRWVVRRGMGPPVRRPVVRCRASGTTLRFVLPLAATRPQTVQFRGDPELARRPMEPLFAALEHLGARVARASAGRSLPVGVRGPLHGGTVTVDASASSQFVSALLLALPTLSRPSMVRIRGRRVSGPYIDATLAVLRQQGIRWAAAGRTLRCDGGQRYRGGSIEIPGDASSAAYLWAAAVASGGRVSVTGASSRAWPQADLVILDLLRDAGVQVRRSSTSVTVSGPIAGPISADFDDAPDLVPLAGALASVSAGSHVLRGGAHASAKESDRRRATVDLARRLGASTRFGARSIRIQGADRPRGIHGPPWTDHRVVMSAAVAALAASSPSTIGDAAAVAKSFPAFWSTLAGLGVEWEAER